MVRTAWGNPVLLVVLAQSFFIFLGIAFFSFNITWLQLALAVLSAVAVELAFMRFAHKPMHFPLSAVAAALGLGLFLRSTSIWIFILAAALAIASKYVLKKRTGHIFNPSNLGILAVVIAFPSYATIEFTQWGDNLYAYMLIAAITFLVSWRAGVFVITASFLASYSVFFLTLLPYLPQYFSAHHYGLLGPSLVLFASFMITDPKTAPKGTRAMLIHGVAVAALYFFLEIQGVRYALFITSFLVAGMNLVFGMFYGSLSESWRSFFDARNFFTGILCIVLFLCGLVPTILHNEAQFSIFRVSPRFMGMGIESGQLLQCRKDTLFTVEDFAPESSSNISSYGAAWGDYDNDGDDDLFVSHAAEPSRLYRNDGGTFVDVTTDSKLSPFTSSSAFFADYDNDGRLDLFAVGPLKPRYSKSQEIEERVKRLARESEVPGIQVFRNTSAGYVDVTRSVGLDTFSIGEDSTATLSFADYDKDGDLDFVLASRGRNFSINSETENTAIEKNLFDPFFDTSFVFMCGENDVRGKLTPYVTRGYLTEDDVDVYVAQRGCVRYQESMPFFSGVGAGTYSRNSAHVLEFMFHIPGSAHLFENRGGARFVEHEDFARQTLARLPEEPVSLLTQHYPFDAVSGRFYQPVSFDWDGDGDTDIFLAVDIGSNILLDNIGGLEFEDVTIKSGLNYLGSGMGVGLADVDRNGHPDIFVTNTLQDYEFVGDGSGFTLRSGRHMGRIGVGWGVSYLDYNLDGFEDVIVANGDIQMTTDVPFGAVGKSFFRANLLLAGDGSGELRDRTWDDLCPDFQSSMALAVSDYDNDGDPDVFVGNVINRPGQKNTNVFYTNHIEGKNYVKVRLAGTTSNSFGVGATVSVTDSKGGTQTKYVLLGSSFYSENSLTLLFGLGDDVDPVDIRVEWPSGKKSFISQTEVNRTLLVRER